MTVSRPRDSADPITALRTEVALGCRVLGAEDQGDLVWGTCPPATRTAAACG